MGLIVPDAIERYLSGLNRASDQVLDEIARRNEARGLPLVDAEVGALLRVLAMSIGATRILEIGTAIVEYNECVAAHPDLLTAIVPLRDGVSIAVKRGDVPDLEPGLDTLARATAALRAADFNDNAAEQSVAVRQRS